MLFDLTDVEVHCSMLNNLMDSTVIDCLKSLSLFGSVNFCLTMISPRPTGKKRYCDCSQYCKGRRTEVHRSTYQRHAPVRQADLETRLARYRRDTIDKSSLSAGTSLEGRSTNRASRAQPQVRHYTVFWIHLPNKI